MFLDAGTRSPLSRARLDDYGIDDLHRAIYERGDVLVIANEPLSEMFAAYVAEHYGERVMFRPATHYGPSDRVLFSVYRFRRAAQPRLEHDPAGSLPRSEEAP